ncbi:N-acetylmuramoyl-L-alanine amidase [Rhodovulum sp. 12E13]|uniref:N-acetylmuramoyl-L-alanine amidase n=1 Tax=Rhodovulum sp. 12E13 TaxID=2203891 RepID=UPI000E171772|nr:N-acetylmuramoyl-L-alanine amidase [Rhodovulum sp. 12E13]RDC71674.1 N-acetylmuramoyl-L-alanine amidase [Rhodovulum sp. 12E13]
MIRRFLAAALALAFSGAVVRAQDAAAPARLDPARSAVTATQEGLSLSLGLTRPVPWRVRALADPPRLVVDLRSAALDPPDAAALAVPGAVTGLRAGPLRADWSRLVLDLDRPHEVVEAGMATGDGAARIDIRLRPAPAGSLAAAPDWASPAFADEAETLAPPPRRGPADDRPVVVLDPGHGGIDPGAVRDGHLEADITLAFARELRDALRRDGRFRVALTRDADLFVSLDGRIAAARRAGADVFVSIHADAVAEGVARGAQVYTLSDAASSRAAAELAERHDRADLLAGVDLTEQDDRIARVLMDMARTETEPRTEALAGTLVDALRGAGIRLHARPRESAAFSVLRAPDIPSVLVEIGFMSTPAELEKLLSEAWRRQAAEALAAGLAAWAEADAARDALLGR